VAGHRDRIRLGTPVERVLRLASGVELRARGCEPERFDAIFFACHSDQALRMLGDPSTREREILGAIDFQSNDVVLHTDQSLMPRRRRAWAAWNYRIPSQEQDRVAVTYNMNILQGLDAPEQFCVTLNDSDAVANEEIIAQFSYDHPVFTPEAVAAQQRLPEINGTNFSYYCGAYWRYGFHEDGVVSALEALKRFEENLRDAQRYLRRAS
jgi:predicted NAD/FAD-binding protein